MITIENKRLDYLDVTKGIGILLVILGHILSESDFIYKIIYAFHMPLFFIIAGYVYNENKYKNSTVSDFIKKKFKSYIIPYFRMALICLIIFGVVLNFRENGINNTFYNQLIIYVKGIIYSKCYLETTPNCSPIWFLTCLFCMEIMFYFIFKYVNKKYIPIIICFIIGVVLNKINIINLPWNLDIALFALPFMYLGLIIKQYNFLEKYKHEYTILFLVIFIISVYFNTIINFNGRNLGNIIFTYSGAISMSLIVLYYSKYLEKSKVLKFFGKNTMFVIGYNYAINYLYLGYFYMFTFIDCWEIKFINITIMIAIFILIRNKIENFRVKQTITD